METTSRMEQGLLLACSASEIRQPFPRHLFGRRLEAPGMPVVTLPSLNFGTPLLPQLKVRKRKWAEAAGKREDEVSGHVVLQTLITELEERVTSRLVDRVAEDHRTLTATVEVLSIRLADWERKIMVFWNALLQLYTRFRAHITPPTCMPEEYP